MATTPDSPVLQHRSSPSRHDIDDQLEGPVPFESWGRYPLYDSTLVPLAWQTDYPKILQDHNGMPTGALAVGMGRSYGDSCLLKSGNLLVTTGMNRLLSL